MRRGFARKRESVHHFFYSVSLSLFLFVFQTPLPEQEGPSTGLLGSFELMSSKDVAYHMTSYDWELFNCVHEVRVWDHSLLSLCFHLTPYPSESRVSLRRFILVYFQFFYCSVISPRCPTAWTHLSHIWEAKCQKDHSEPGPILEEVQWNPVLGDHRGVSLLSAQ